MHRPTLRLFVVVAVFVLLLPVSAMASHSWGNYHWARTSNPFTLKVIDNVTSAWDSYLDVAEGDWNSSTVLNLIEVSGPVSNPKRCTSVAGQIEVCNATYGQNGWLGIAGISISGSHITKGYTKLNDTYFNSPSYNTPAWRQMVTCQEIGHDFGLDHQDENFNNANLGTCMDYTNSPGTNQHPNKHDYDQLVAIYTHLDSTTTVSAVIDSMAKSMARPRSIREIMADAGQWGTPVRFDELGRPNVFIMPTGMNKDGETEFEVTHVLWTPDSHRSGGLDE